MTMAAMDMVKVMGQTWYHILEVGSIAVDVRLDVGGKRKRIIKVVTFQFSQEISAPACC